MSSTNTILTIREMIDLAFGDPEINVVNHKLIQTILFLLAKQLRLLERRVELEMGYISSVPETSLSVTEIKIHANQEKPIKKKGKGANAAYNVPRHGTNEGLGKIKKEIVTESKVGSSKANAVKERPITSGTEKANKYHDSLSSTDKTVSDKTSSDQKSSSDKTVTIKSGSEKDSVDLKASGKSQVPRKSPQKVSKQPEDSRKYLEIIEESREKELRVIHQRADSKEVYEKTPTPIASLDSIEAQYEKLLVVERLPSSEAKAMIGREQKPIPRLSVVTQDQFAELANAVRDLQIRFAPIAPPGFPENAKFLQELRKGASLTDAMAALQLSARLEAAEKTLAKMLNLITELATQTGIDLCEIPEEVLGPNILLGLSSDDAKTVSSEAYKKVQKKAKKQPAKQAKDISPLPTPSEESLEQFHLGRPIQVENLQQDFIGQKENQDTVTHLELDTATQALYDQIMKNVTSITARNIQNADNAYKTATRLEGRLEASLNLGNKMENLESLVSNYATQINILDTSLSSQMTNYQEQLTQMQHDLEAGLETMAEALANTGGDTTAVAELNANFTSLQLDFYNMAEQQKELKTAQNTFSYDLEALWKEIELLKAIKSDRDEVADALRDKAGIGTLNGLVSMQQFDAVRGDYEKRIGAAYNKFNNQEIVWQKAIDDILKALNEKADWLQLISLKEDINKYLNILKSRIHAMMEIVGEPRAASVTRRLHRDALCISCSTPAHMALEEPGIVPALPAFQTRPPAIGEEAPKPNGDGDYGVCYPGQPIPHPKDPRTHMCNRYCGGSHTAVNTTLSRAPGTLTVRPALRQVTTGIGLDGKPYIMDEPQPPKPCTTCNAPKSKPQHPVQNKQVSLFEDIDSDMMPPDFRQMSEMMSPEDKMSVTPPPAFENQSI